MPTILIADDAGLFQALETSPTLRSACRLIPVRSASDLLARASTDAPDLFLLDADQFGASGRECIRSLKADRRLASVPIILAAREPGLFEPMMGERDRLFAKPLRYDEVGKALKRVLPLARRRSPRVPVSVPVTCRVGGEDPVRTRSKDLASGGLFLRTPWEPARGTRFMATFKLPARGGAPAEDGEEISAVCEVVRLVGSDEADQMAGVGAAIVEISEPDAGRLKRFVGSGA